MSVVNPWNRLPRVSSDVDIRNLTRHSPGQLVLGVHALSREFGLEDLLRTGSGFLNK